jgi:O-succinylbenzoic acid--CoA ligase
VEAFADRLKAALQGGASMVLEDPAWPAAWKHEMAERASMLENVAQPAFLVATSGTTGLPKWCIHSSDTLLCAAGGYRERFGSRGIIHAVNVLPVQHIGGLMPFVRCLACDGRVHQADYRSAASLAEAPFPLEEASISLVPTQLRRMLQETEAAALLRRFALVLVGGAACPPGLLKQAREAGLRLSPCYGSTETAAMVTALDPDDFLAGTTGVGKALPHAGVGVDEQGRVHVQADSLLLGYLPAVEGFSRAPFIMGDIGSIDSEGNLDIHGRSDRVIITGGKKVHPERVEAAAVETGLVIDAACRGCPDEDWGTRVELDVTVRSATPELKSSLLAELKRRLPSYAVPKEIRIMNMEETP